MTYTTTTVSYTTTPQPEAHISFKKGRLGVKNGNEIYLAPGTEFEIELFNPKTVNVLAKISINGAELSSGIVLKPGQRVFLERYTDVQKKFKFETYEVDANDSAAMAAIASNGLVSVSFYDENLGGYNFQVNGTVNILDKYLDKGWNSGTGGSPFTTTNCFYSSSMDMNMLNDGRVSLTSSLDSKSLGLNESKRSTKETGRVEKGSKSSQKLQTVQMEFNYWSTNTVTYKLLPVSEEKPVGLFCTECRMKKKKDSWKFCPSCGTPYEF